MSFRMNLWQVNGEQLREIKKSSLDNEQRLEDWIEAAPGILDMSLLLIGRQVATAFRGRIDLLALDEEGNLVILELKRDRTPRDIVAQALDYASWVKDLSYTEIASIASKYLDKLPLRFKEQFDVSLPETLNVNHSIVIVASKLDDATERIVQYLATEHGVNINVIFFNFYRVKGQEIVGRAWLMDPDDVRERSTSRKQAPWPGYYFVNVGDGDHRRWEDNVEYGYIGAGQGEKYSRALQRLHTGDEIFAYMKGEGYVGYGKVTEEAVPITEFIVAKDGQPLLDHELEAPLAQENKDDPEMSEWAVGVDWLKTFPREEARTFKGVFANQNIVCKLRHPETVQFVKQEFDV